jgi:hypothetical protein
MNRRDIAATQHNLTVFSGIARIAPDFYFDN